MSEDEITAKHLDDLRRELERKISNRFELAVPIDEYARVDSEVHRLKEDAARHDLAIKGYEAALTELKVKLGVLYDRSQRTGKVVWGVLAAVLAELALHLIRGGLG